MKTKAMASFKELKLASNMFMTTLKIINKKVKEEYEEDLHSKLEEVIVKIANDYSLDLSELKRKYLKKKKKTVINSNDSDGENECNISDNESVVDQCKTVDENPLLYKFENDDNTYYVELVENGKVFDVNHNEVGVWKNGNVELNLDLVEQLRMIEVQIKNCDDQIITNIVGNSLSSDQISVSATIDSFVKSTKDSIKNSYKRKPRNISVDI